MPGTVLDFEDTLMRSGCHFLSVGLPCWQKQIIQLHKLSGVVEGEKVEAVTDFIFLGSKITADDDCSHVIERHLLLGRKAMTNLDSILKSRDIALLTKVHIVKAMIFFQ